MSAFTGPDKDHLRAAEDWLELGGYQEAYAELYAIAPLLRAHPQVLEMRCQIYAMAGKWEEVLQIATTLSQSFASMPQYWRHRARALHSLGRTSESMALLSQQVALLQRCRELEFDLACYAAHLGQMAETESLLELIFSDDPDGGWRVKALQEPMLDQFWTQSRRSTNL